MAYKKRKMARKPRRTVKRRTVARRKTRRVAKPRRTVKGSDDYYNNPLLLLGLKRDYATHKSRPVASVMPTTQKPVEEIPTTKQVFNFAKDMLVHNLSYPFYITGLTDDQKSFDFIRNNFPSFYGDAEKSHDIFISKNKYVNGLLSFFDRQKRPGNVNSYLDVPGKALYSYVLPSLKDDVVKSVTDMSDTVQEISQAISEPQKALMKYVNSGNHPEVIEDVADYISDTIVNYKRKYDDAFNNGILVPQVVDDMLDKVGRYSIRDFNQEDEFKKISDEFFSGKPGFSRGKKAKIPLPDDWATNPDYKMNIGNEFLSKPHPESKDYLSLLDNFPHLRKVQVSEQIIPDAARTRNYIDKKGTIDFQKKQYVQPIIIEPTLQHRNSYVDVITNGPRRKPHWKYIPPKTMSDRNGYYTRPAFYDDGRGNLHSSLPNGYYMDRDKNIYFESKKEI